MSGGYGIGRVCDRRGCVPIVPMRHDQIALQLYTVRHLAADDLPGTLAGRRRRRLSVGRAGGSARDGPAELARLLDETGLRAVAAHEGIERLRADPTRWPTAWPRSAATAAHRSVDARRRPPDRPTTCGGFAAELGAFAGRLGGRGIRLGYHNHAFEFAPLDGTTVWDVLLAELPPEVELELDVYWAAVGGRDPVAEIGATPDRVRLLHMKDRAGRLGAARCAGGGGDPGLPRDRRGGSGGGRRLVHRRAGRPAGRAGRHRYGGALPRVTRELTLAQCALAYSTVTVVDGARHAPTDRFWVVTIAAL